MVIDSSVLIALLLGEPETPRFVAAIATAPRQLVSAASYLETAIVMISRSGPDAKGKLDRLLVDLAVDVIPSRRNKRFWPSRRSRNMAKAWATARA